MRSCTRRGAKVVGLLVPPGDAPALTSALLRLLEDPAFARRLGQAGRAGVAEHFSLQAMVDGYRGLYSDLMRDG